jgi:hypothetical protein
MRDEELPEVVGLCPDNFAEFYVPHGGICPECDKPLVEYVKGEQLREVVKTLSNLNEFLISLDRHNEVFGELAIVATARETLARYGRYL